MAPSRSVDWINGTFLLIVHVLGLGGTVLHGAARGVSGSAVMTAAAFAVVTIFAISAGYHRLFSHRTYEAHPALRVFLLLFGAAAFQTSALEWSANHRKHHARTDTDADPYSIRRGFWHAHVGWVLEKMPLGAPTMQLSDLRRDPLVMWQHRNFLPLALLMGFGLPLLMGALFGDPFAFLLWAGFTRLVFVYQVTFAINSFAHLFGRQPYSDRDTSRDSLVAALLTFGEGYHNFHHTFPGDYRNGALRHQYDPTKWILFVLSKLGIVKKLKRTPPAAIARAREQMRERSAARLLAGFRSAATQLRARA